VLPSDGAGSLARGKLVASHPAVVDDHAATWEEYALKGYEGVVVSFADSDASAPAVVLVLMGPKATWDGDRVVLERILASVRVLPESAAVGPGTEAQAPTVAYLESLATSVTGPAIEGVVLRGARPAAGVAVELFVETAGEPRAAQRAATASNGVFRFAGVERGAYALDVQSGTDTRVRVHTSLVPDVPRARLIVVLGQGAVEGVAYDRLGKRAAGLRVRAGSYLGPPRDSHGAVTRGDGSFRIDALPAGTWSITLSLPTRGERFSDVRSDSVDLAWGETKTIDLGSPVREALLTGRVRSVGGALVAGPAAYVAFERIGGRAPLASALDAEGRFSQRLPAGDYEVKVLGLAFQAAHTVTRTVSAADLETEVTLETPSVLGRVWDLATSAPAVRAAQWAPVVLLERPGSAQATMAATTPDGTFAFHGVPPGSYRLHAAFGPEDARRRSEEVAVEVTEGRDVPDVRLDLPAK
jgi:hypothetical protein